MEPKNSIDISPVFVNSGFFFQNNKGESQYSNFGNFSTAKPTVVSKSFCNIIFTTFSTLNVSRQLKNPKGKDHLSVTNKSLVTRKVTGKPWLSRRDKKTNS